MTYGTITTHKVICPGCNGDGFTNWWFISLEDSMKEQSAKEYNENGKT